MGVSAKPRKKYRPRAKLQNPIQHVIESLSPVRNQVGYVTNWKIKLHAAMNWLTKGEASKKDIDTLLAGHYLCGAWVGMGIGTDYKSVLICSHVALADLYIRGDKTQRYVLKALEMQALNDMIELHDAMIDEVTVDQMEKARLIAMRNLTKYQPGQVYMPVV